MMIERIGFYRNTKDGIVISTDETEQQSYKVVVHRKTRYEPEGIVIE